MSGITGVYSGFSQDMSTGLIFGVNLPTGDFRFAGFDRDVEIGSGSTDVIVGGYHQGKFGKTGQAGWYCSGKTGKRRLRFRGGLSTWRRGRAPRRGVYWEGWSFDNGFAFRLIAQVIASLAQITTRAPPPTPATAAISG